MASNCGTHSSGCTVSGVRAGGPPVLATRMSTPPSSFIAACVDRLDIVLEVADEGRGAARAFLADRVGGLLQPVAAARRHQHMRAFRRERLGDAAPEAAAGGQDDGALAGKAEIHGQAPVRDQRDA